MQSLIFRHWGIVFLSFYWIFILYLFLPGSLEGDEAIYAQVIRETLARESFLVLFWRDEVWMEKPPLFFWCGLILAKLGISYEYVGRIISGFFGFLGVLLVYATVYGFCRNRRSAIVAAVSMMSMPLYVEASRYGILDTMLAFFVFLSGVGVWCFVRSRWSGWLHVSACAAGCGVMVKGAPGMIAVGVAVALFLFFHRRFLVCWREVIWSCLLFLGMILPWHVYMVTLYGREFFDVYILYHVVERIGSNFIASPYGSYGAVLFGQFGVWILAIPLTLFLAFGVWSQSAFSYRRDVVFFLVVSVLIYVSFSLSATKVPFYLLPLLPFLACGFGFSLYLLFVHKCYRYFFCLVGLMTFQFFPVFFLQYSDFSRVNLLLPRIAMGVFNPSEFYFYVCGAAVFLGILFVGFYAREKVLVRLLPLGVICIIGMNVIFPFSLDRSRVTQEVGRYVSSSVLAYDVKHVFVSPQVEMRTNTLLLYVPLGIKVEWMTTDFSSFPGAYLQASLCVESSALERKKEGSSALFDGVVVGDCKL